MNDNKTATRVNDTTNLWVLWAELENIDRQIHVLMGKMNNLVLELQRREKLAKE